MRDAVRIEVQGAVGDTAMSPEFIQDILGRAEPLLLLAGQGSFEGRPFTRLLATADYVIKERGELTFSARDARRWIEKALREERELKVYCPEKTWFLQFVDDRCVIANITPRLTPLNQVLVSAEPPADWLRYLERVLAMYLDVGSRCDSALDDGLSNFGLDAAGRVFYLDDETYPFAELVGLAHGLAVWVRQLRWLDAGKGLEIGRFLRQEISRSFADPHWLYVFREQFSEAFWADQRQAEVGEALVTGLFDKSHRPLIRQEKGHRLDPDKPLAILGDIHANIPALEAVVKSLLRMGVTQGLVVGDIVGYGPYPNECVKRVRDLEWAVIKGNHDHGLGVPSARGLFSKNALWALEWSESRVPDELKEWLLELPPHLEGPDWMAVHGAPTDKSYMYGYIYNMTFSDNLTALAEKGKKICFHGHSHLQGAYFRKGKLEDKFEGEVLSLANIHHVLVCPGSVGQPRGGHPGAEFAVYDPAAQTIRFHRIDYDRSTLTSLMEKEGFPVGLIRRLSEGS